MGMVRTIALAAAAGLATTGAAIAAGHNAPAVQAAQEAFRTAIVEKGGGLGAVFVADGIMMPAQGGIYKGAQQIDAWAAQFPPVADMGVEFGDVQDLGDGHMILSGTYTLTLGAEAGGGTIEGEWLSVVRREGDALKFVRHATFAPREPIVPQ